MRTNPRIVGAYRFFRKIGVGGVLGENAATCLALARAECEALERNATFEWQNDESPDISWMDDRTRAEYFEGELDILVCVAKDTFLGTGASLGGIVLRSSGDPNYVRTVEAELAVEMYA